MGYDDEKWARATLRVFVEEPDPSVAHNFGVGFDVLRGKHGGWRVELDIAHNTSMEDLLAGWVEAFDARSGALAAWSRQGEIDLFVGFSSGNGQGGFELNQATLAGLARHPVDVVVDLYPPTRRRLSWWLLGVHGRLRRWRTGRPGRWSS